MSRQQKTAIILANLGTPDEATPGAVKRYLNEFLSDARVVEGKGPRRWLWLMVLKGIVLNIRPKRVAHAYSTIWEDDSPMRNILNRQVAALKLQLQADLGEHSPEVFAAMTYGKPSFSHLLADLQRTGFKQVLVIPMYPQYSATTTAPIYDQVAKYQLAQREVMDIRIVKQYYDHPAYIDALSAHMSSYFTEHGQGDKLVLSYHGIPKEYADKGDPYPKQCHHTSELLAKAMGLPDQAWMTTFQSRFGPAEWMQPYTDKTLEKLPAQGVKSLRIACPAFSADCLETLEEIAVENCDVFKEAGGEDYQYIPALNDDPAFINLMAALVKEQAGDWVGTR
ncbi:MAG: ferrochelatase [Pontibacterium sp.]